MVIHLCDNCLLLNVDLLKVDGANYLLNKALVGCGIQN